VQRDEPEPYRSIAAFREGAGVEISAALKVCRRDVDEKTQTVHVHGTKNSWRDRPVFVEEWAWPYIVAAAKGKLPDAPLFVEKDGHPVNYYRALAAHRVAVKALKLPPKYTMHDSRHSFAVRCMKAGIDPQFIANNLGHRDATMVLRIYGKYRVTSADFRRMRTGTGGQ
jgi:integrase